MIPSCLGAAGSVRAMQIAQAACLASEVQIFWPVSFQPPSARTARVVSPARSEPAPGSLNSWHHEVAAQRRRQEPLLLLRRPVLDQRRDHPGADGQAGSPHPGRPHLLGDDHLLERARFPPPRAGQVRHDPAVVGQPPVRSARGQPGDRGEFLADLGPERASPPASSIWTGGSPRQGQPGHPLGPLAGRAEQGAQRQRPPVVQVGLVLPGVADPAEHLDVLVRAPDRGVERHHRGHRGGELALAGRCVAEARRRRPVRRRAASQTAAAACSAAVSIRAQRCLTAWNWPIGRPN